MKYASVLMAAVIAIAIIIFSLSPPASTQEETSRWGSDDEIGAANYLTNATTLEAASLIQTGQTYQLGIEITEETLGPGGRQAINTLLPLQANETELFVDDYIAGHLSVGTQIDGLGHAVVEGRSYNNVSLSENLGLNGLNRLGIETIPPIATRGILLNIAAVRDVDSLQLGEAITVADIEAALEQQNIQIGTGDVVLLHTGWMDAMLRADPLRYVNSEPGLGVEAAQFLAGQNVVAVGLDVAQIDPIGETDDYSRPAHKVLLIDNGVFTLENINTSELARDKVYEFMLVFGPIRYGGAAQAPINPIAIR